MNSWTRLKKRYGSRHALPATPAGPALSVGGTAPHRALTCVPPHQRWGRAAHEPEGRGGSCCSYSVLAGLITTTLTRRTPRLPAFESPSGQPLALCVHIMPCVQLSRSDGQGIVIRLRLCVCRPSTCTDGMKTYFVRGKGPTNSRCRPWMGLLWGWQTFGCRGPLAACATRERGVPRCACHGLQLRTRSCLRANLHVRGGMARPGGGLMRSRQAGLLHKPLGGGVQRASQDWCRTQSGSCRHRR